MWREEEIGSDDCAAIDGGGEEKTSVHGRAMKPKENL